MLPFRIWMPKNSTIANFGHPVFKSWQRPCHRPLMGYHRHELGESVVVCLWPVVSVLGPVDNQQSRLCLLALIWLQGNEEAINLQAVPCSGGGALFMTITSNQSGH